MSSHSRSLIVTAHPDDESLFFAGLILSSSKKFDLLCLTSGQTEGREGERTKELESAGQSLGIHEIFHGQLKDDPGEGLSQSESVLLFQKLDISAYESVYTHSILGEYGHSHHQDCSFFCHSYFEKDLNIPVKSVAFNIPADEHVLLNSLQFNKKAQVLTETYKLETRRFYNLLPITSTESFSRIGFAEANAIYHFLKNGELMNESEIVYHQGILPLLKARPLSELVENFFQAYFADGSN